MGVVKSKHQATKAAIYHRKNEDVRPVGDYSKVFKPTMGENQIIADANNLSLTIDRKKDDHIGLRFHFKDCEINLPHDFHIAAAINEMIK